MSAQRGSLLSPPPLPSHPPPGRTQTEGRVAESRRDGEIRKENLSGRKNAPRAKTFPFSPFTAQLQNRAPARTELARARSGLLDPRRHGRGLPPRPRSPPGSWHYPREPLAPAVSSASTASTYWLLSGRVLNSREFRNILRRPIQHPLASLVQPELPSRKFDYHVFGAPSLLKDLPRPTSTGCSTL